MLKRADLTIYQGDDYAALVTVLNPDKTTADLTGFTAQAQIRASVADEAPDVAAEFVCSIVLPNQVSLWLPHDQTVLMAGVSYVWDLQLRTPAVPPQIITVLYGEVDLIQEVTREAVA